MLWPRLLIPEVFVGFLFGFRVWGLGCGGGGGGGGEEELEFCSEL